MTSRARLESRGFPKLAIAEHQGLANQGVATQAVDISVLHALRNFAQPLSLKRRQRLTIGAPNTLFYVRSGLIAAESCAPGGQRVVVELLYPGVVFAPALTPTNSAITYSPLDESTIWVFPATKLKDTVSIGGELSEFVLRRLNLQHSRTQLHIASLVSLDGEQRAAAFLLKVACHFGQASQGNLRFRLPLSRVDIADYLALNPDTLSRVMSRFVRTRVLSRSRRSEVEIPDIRALRALCPFSDNIAKLHSDVIS